MPTCRIESKKSADEGIEKEIPMAKRKKVRIPDDQIRDQPCDRCGAEAGQSCVDARYAVDPPFMRTFHPERKAQAMEAMNRQQNALSVAS